jgi:hypothetical protein
MHAHFASTARRLIFLLAAACAVLCGKVEAQNFTYTTNTDGSLNITGYNGTDTTVVVPSTILVNGVNVTVTSIGAGAFQYNTTLTIVTISDSVTSIGNEAFAGCYSLTNFTIGSGVTNIGEDPFSQDSSLIAINVNISNLAYSSGAGVLFNRSQTTLIQYPCGLSGSYTVPNSVTSIGDDAFTYCPSLTSLYFMGNAPNVDSITSEDNPATVYYLAGTSGWSSFFDGLPTVMLNPPIPASSLQVTLVPGGEVTANAQWQVDGGIPQPNGATVLGLSVGNHTVSFSAISGWITPANMTVSVSANSATTATGTYVSQFTYTINSDGSINITGFTGSYTPVTIPSTIPVNGVNLAVTSIGADAFYEQIGIINIAIPNSVTSIGDEAFFDCAALANVTIPNSVTSIGNEAFIGCNSLTRVTIGNSVLNIGDNAFESCTNLTSVTIPDSVINIGNYAFTGCGLTNVTIGNGVTSIGGGAFAICNNLTSVFFTGNAPSTGVATDHGMSFGVFTKDSNATVYYFPNTNGWSSTFAGVPAVMMQQPAISTPPDNQAIVDGANATFTVSARGIPAPSYQWQVSMDGGNTWNDVSGNVYAGATTANLTISNATAAQLGYQYQAVLTNYAGTTTTTPVPLVVGTSSAQLTWLQNNFTATQLGNPGIVGDTADPAGDGIPNLLKYAFNLNPWVEGQPLLPQPVFAAGNLTLTFPAPQADLAYIVEASADLVNWSTAGVTQTNNPTNGTVTGSYGLAGAGPVFLQIVVAPAP